MQKKIILASWIISNDTKFQVRYLCAHLLKIFLCRLNLQILSLCFDLQEFLYSRLQLLPLISSMRS